MALQLLAFLVFLIICCLVILASRIALQNIIPTHSLIVHSVFNLVPLAIVLKIALHANQTTLGFIIIPVYRFVLMDISVSIRPVRLVILFVKLA